VARTDAELIAAAAKCDGIAFQLLYERHWQPVYRFAWLLTRSVSDAEDITQECFLALVRKPASFDARRSQLRTWLFAVARNQHLLRCRNRTQQAGPDEEDTYQAPAGLVEELIRLETAGAVRRAVEALPRAQREALYLFEFEGLSLADTAAILRIEPNAVKARLFRAREQLRGLLAPYKRG